MKDTLIEHMEFDEGFDEFVECEVEHLKFKAEKNILLLENLLKEVSSQIISKKPNLNKLKEMLI